MINEVITGDATSAATNPTAAVSDVITDDWSAQGQLLLECQAPSGEWKTISNVRGVVSVSTPDPNIQYRFRAINVPDNVRVYFGP